MRSGRNLAPMIPSFLSLSVREGIVSVAPRMFERSGACARDHLVDKKRCCLGDYWHDALQATNLEETARYLAIRMFWYICLAILRKSLRVNAILRFFKNA